jgi:hypothetical protein
MHNRSHPMLFLAGTALMVVAVFYGSQAAPVWFAQSDGRIGATVVRVADVSGADLVPVSLHPRHLGHVLSPATVKPNGTGCPGASTAPPAAPGDDQAAANAPDASLSANSALTDGAGAAGGSACPPTASDVRTDIARGSSPAKPEPRIRNN